MAKITALPRIAAGDADGTELLPVVKAGETMAAPIGDIIAPAAQPFLDMAAQSAATAEAASGPTYATIAEGLAATGEEGTFAVNTGGGIVSIYRNEGGAAVLQRRLATSDALASADDGLGIDLVSRVPYPVLTRAHMKALDTVRYRTAILTEGERDGTFHFRLGDYAARVSADTAEGVFIAANGIPTAIGAWVRSYSRLKAEFFGCIGDGSDDAIGFNAALDFARRTGETLFLAGGKNYRTTKSLNATKAAQSDGYPVRIEGGSKIASLITGDLDEPYPVLDFTNNKRGGLSNIVIRTTTTSLDTCSLLLAETFATGVNLVTLQNTSIYNQSANAQASMIGVCSDQLFVDNFEVLANGPNAKAGFKLDGRNALGVASKFRAIGLFGGDLTITEARTSNFICAGGPGFDVENFTGIGHQGCYYASLNFADGSAATATSMARFSGTDRAISPSLVNCRSENQSLTNPNTDVFEINGTIQNARFLGVFRAGAGGFLMRTGDGTGALYRSEIRAGLSYGVFRNMGPMISTEVFIHDGNNVLGTFSATGISASKNLTLSGRVGSIGSVMSALATVPGLVVRGVNTDDGAPAASRVTFNSDRVAFPRSDSPINFRASAKGPAKQLTLTSYMPGALAQVASVSLPSSVLSYVGGGEATQVYPYVEVEFDGQTAAAWAAGGSVALTITQGSTTMTLATLGAIPAGQQGVRVRAMLFYTSSSGSLNAVVEIASAPIAGGSPLALGPRRNALSGISRDSTDPIVFGLQVNNTADSLQYLYSSIKG